MMYHIIPVTNYMQNCTLIWCDDTKEAAIVDPGGDVETLIAEIEQRQLKLTKVLLTHGHFDHVAGTAQIVEHFHVPVYGPHKDDNFLIEDLEQQCRMFNFPSGKSFTPDQWLNEGDTVTIGKTITLSVYIVRAIHLAILFLLITKINLSRWEMYYFVKVLVVLISLVVIMPI